MEISVVLLHVEGYNLVCLPTLLMSPRCLRTEYFDIAARNAYRDYTLACPPYLCHLAVYLEDMLVVLLHV